MPGKAPASEIPLQNPATRQEHKSPFSLLVLYNLQPHAMSLRLFGGLLSSVALIDVGQFHRLPGRLVDGLGQLAHVLPLWLVGRAYAQGEQVKKYVRFAVNQCTVVGICCATTKL